MLSMHRPHDRVQLDPGEGRTKQSFAEESNINLIMAKYEKTGMLDHLNTHRGDYANFIGAEDYHTSMNLIREAGEAFMTIPAGVRARFDNDPARFLAFVQNEKNLDEMIEMGLARKGGPEAPGGPEPKTPEDPPLPVDPPPDGDGDDGGRSAKQAKGSTSS